MTDCCCKDSKSGPTITTSAASEKTARCPRCGQPGQPVGLRTLKHQVKPEHLKAVEESSFCICRTPSCQVVYYSHGGAILTKTDVRFRVGFKETADPVQLCYCFGFTEAMVVEEIRTTGKCDIPLRIAAEVKNGNCACEIRNPQGSCCLGSVTAAVKEAKHRF